MTGLRATGKKQSLLDTRGGSALGMQMIIRDIPNPLTTLVKVLRAKLRDQDCLARHPSFQASVPE